MSKVCIMGDLHLGLSKGSPIFHDIAIKYAEWVDVECRKRNIQQIWQVGDWYHSRTAIDLPTLHCSHKILNILSPRLITIIPGNHDVWLNDDCEVNSLSLIKGHTNVTIYDRPRLSVNGEVFFAPWATKLEEIQNCKILIGHADIQSFSYGKGKISNHGFKGSDLAEKADLLIFGHYHGYQERRYGNSRLIYTGSCFQHNYGESDNIPYLFFLDTETLELEKVENTISPRFYYIKDEKDLDKVKNNFVSVEVETWEDDIIDKINANNPLEVRKQLIEKSVTEISEYTPIVEESDNKLIDIPLAIEQFVGLMENLTEEEKVIVTKDMKELYSKCNNGLV